MTNAAAIAALLCPGLLDEKWLTFTVAGLVSWEFGSHSGTELRD
jgi:hypothetical protein